MTAVVYENFQRHLSLFILRNMTGDFWAPRRYQQKLEDPQDAFFFLSFIFLQRFVHVLALFFILKVLLSDVVLRFNLPPCSPGRFLAHDRTQRRRHDSRLI